MSGGLFLAALLLGVPAPPAAALGVAAGVLLTGGLHEDGLSDTADGFGGGRDPERRLEIMRDSRIGSYGAAALGLSLLLRWSALASIARPEAGLLALVAAHAASRAPLALFLRLTPPARADGLSASAGRPSVMAAGIALMLGAAALLLLGPLAACVAALLLMLVFAALRQLALAKIGGQTGDVAGALQQAGEIAVLLVAAAHFT
jgi:adenosylcobinamide-GDP ribazoletransferase